MITPEQMRKIKVGDILPCRERVVESVEYDELYTAYPWVIRFTNAPSGLFSKTGISTNISHNLFDITQIIPAAFDWGTVKPGDKFNSGTDEVFTYIGPHADFAKLVWVQTRNGEAFCTAKSNLAPIHDKDAP
jgi:hypothetical protein